MADIPPTKDAFVEMMKHAVPVCPPNDPWYTAVIYEAHLEHVDPEEPLWRVPYFGQTVRQDTAIAIFKARQDQHVYDSAREDKDLGFHAVIDMFGTNKVEWRIVSSKTGPRSEMQAWANAEEIRLIAEHGGILQDMDAKLTQTLNLTKGGKGDASAVWDAIDARRRRVLNKFKAEMEKYVAEHDSALVPYAFVDDDGYRLGERLMSFRQGSMRKGLPEEAEINAWAEAMPKWVWNGKETDEYRKELAQLGKKRSITAFAKFKPAMEMYVAEHGSALVPSRFIDKNGYRLAQNLNSFRQGTMWKGMPFEAEVVAWANALPKWAWVANETDEYRKECGKRVAEEHAARTRVELVRARLLAVPFEKSQTRRAKMRAASEDFWHGYTKLYMVSKDGQTIRRVQNDGCMGERYIVCRVVDPAPPDALDSD